uniref:NADH-ubiquinone oxidoreductase chain 1 n=1 Tax=Livia junci TaxID=1449964 RepID=A0A344A2J5_9HEMI|nr:NADH dehydrogenase subunit 1 [Livia junci]AWU48986.1 NADH dehydrogenase subunit 1 [Livia junci]
MCCMIMLIFSFVGVAFLTLLERKVLGFIQNRKGPMKVGVYGVFQPFSDAIKLYTKEFFIPLKINFYPYWLSPIFSMLISMLVWLVFPYYYLLVSWKYSILFVFSIMSLSIFGVLISGWASNSCYSILGSIRAIAQSISYEVSFFFLLVCLMLFTSSSNFNSFLEVQINMWLIFSSFPLFLMLFISFLAELNRSPFDFAEGESELVSGFNIEYGSTGFAFIFLAEYLSILFSGMLMSLMFFSNTVFNINFFLKLLSVSFLIILIRGVLPRYRYDKLMNLCWKIYLSSSLMLIMFYCGVSIL